MSSSMSLGSIALSKTHCGKLVVMVFGRKIGCPAHREANMTANLIGHQRNFIATFLFIILLAVTAKAQDTDSMVTAWVEALNANMPPNLNPAAIADLFAEDALQHHVMGPPPGTADPLVGRAAQEQFYAGFDKRWFDWTHEEVRRTVQGNHAVWEGTAQGTHKESGKPVSIPIVFSMDFDNDGKVKEVFTYVNGGMIAKQLG